jgi:hypothetical protein
MRRLTGLPTSLAHRWGRAEPWRTARRRDFVQLAQRFRLGLRTFDLATQLVGFLERAWPPAAKITDAEWLAFP